MGNRLKLASISGAAFLFLPMILLAQDALTAEEAVRYADLDGRPLHSFTNVDLADYLQLRTKLFKDTADRPSPAEEIGHFARKGLDQPFRLNAVRWDLAESDCVVFTERCIAMACAADWESYYLLSERLRHKDGIVEYRNRNFFTLGDYVPNNAWLFRNVSEELASQSGAAATFTHVVRPKVFKEIPTVPGKVRIIFKGSDYQSGIKEVRTETYIPRDRVPEVLEDLKTGDIALVLRAAAQGHVGCDHMVILVREDDGRVLAVAGSPPRARSEELLSFLHRYKFVVGFSFLRLREDARQACMSELERLEDSVDVQPASSLDSRVEALRASRAAAAGHNSQ